MTATLSQPAELLAAVYGGMLAGLLYDFFRLLRLPFPDRRLINALFDLLFYAAAGVFCALFLLYLCGGAVRAYHMFGIGSGAFLEQFFLSRPIRRALIRTYGKILRRLQKKSGQKAGNSLNLQNKNKE